MIWGPLSITRDRAPPAFKQFQITVIWPGRCGRYNYTIFFQPFISAYICSSCRLELRVLRSPFDGVCPYTPYSSPKPEIHVPPLGTSPLYLPYPETPLPFGKARNLEFFLEPFERCSFLVSLGGFMSDPI